MVSIHLKKVWVAGVCELVGQTLRCWFHHSRYGLLVLLWCITPLWSSLSLSLRGGLRLLLLKSHLKARLNVRDRWTRQRETCNQLPLKSTVFSNTFCWRGWSSLDWVLAGSRDNGQVLSKIAENRVQMRLSRTFGGPCYRVSPPDNQPHC